MSDEYNRGGLIAFTFTMVFVLGFFVYIVAVHPGIDLNEKIQDPAALLALEQDKLAKDVDISGVTEPWVANADMVKHGKKLFAQNCAVCHGAEGKGDGAGGAALNPKPRNLVEGPWKKGGGYIGWYNVLHDGIAGGGMVSWKAAISAKDRWALVQFIDSITKAKVQEDPAQVAAFGKTAD